jgi:hypothetical protein
MDRHAKEELSPAEEARLAEIAVGCMSGEDLTETVRRMCAANGLDFKTNFRTLKVIIGYQIERAQDGKGTNCTGCGGHAQVQWRKINRGQVYAALHLRDHFQANGLDEGFHYIKWEDVLGLSAMRSRELPKLRHWGLVKGIGEDTGNPHQALKDRPVQWTVCPDPEYPKLRDPPLYRYLAGELKLPYHAVVFHNQFVCFKGPLETVDQVEGFSADEYMAEVRRRQDGS